jgi:hypothetical protein
MMKTADSRLGPDRALRVRPQFGGSSAGRRFIQSETRSVVVVIADVLQAKAHQMSLVYWDHVVQYLTAYAAHPSFRHSVLPRTANTHPDRLDPARLQKRAHLGTEFPVTIKDDVSVWAWERQRLSELLHNPLAGRVCVVLKWRMRRRRCSMTKKQYSTRKLSVDTVKKSKAAITSR